MRSRRPIFLHTGWRSAGTWLWSRMREQPDVLGFYEPLNEALASMARADIGAFRTDSWASNHPEQERPYYAEYAPLMRRFRRGVRGYREAFALDGWFAGKAGVPRGLERYIASLVRHAARRDRVGVFKFTRTLGRMPWITRAFPDALHVVVVRNPLEQWHSAWQQAHVHGNPYFAIMPWLVLDRNFRNGKVRATAKALGVRPIALGGGRLQRRYDRAIAPVSELDAEQSYRAFLVSWLLGSAAAYAYGELAVDVEQARRDADYRAMLEQAITTRGKIGIDLRDDRDAGVQAARRAAGMTPGFSVERVHTDARKVLASIRRDRTFGIDIASRLEAKLDESLALVRVSDEFGRPPVKAD